MEGPSTRRFSPRTDVWLLLTLCGVALSLRAAGFLYGLPDDVYHPDTPKQLYRVAGFVAGRLVPEDTYPTLHMYAVALLLKVMSLLDPRAYVSRPSLTQIAATARLLNAVLAVGMIPLVYLIGRRLADRRTGLLAAALLAVSGLHVLHAHYEMGDVPQAFFVVAGVAAATRVARTGSPGAYLLAAGLVGLAASAKYYGVVAFGSLVAAAVAAPRASWRRTLWLLAVAGATTVAVFAVTTPLLLVTPLEFLAQMRDSPELFAVAAPPVWHRPIIAARVLLGLALDAWGPLLTALGVVGTLLVVRQGVRAAVVLAAPALVIAVYAGWRANYLDDRNLVVLAPFLCLTTGFALAWLADRGRLGAVAAALVATTLLLPAAVDASHVAYLFWQDDTRRLAKRWSERALPPPVAVAHDVYWGSREAYREVEAGVLLTDSTDYTRYVDWYSPLRSPGVARALDLLRERGKLLKRFELMPRAFTARTLSYYDLDSWDVPYAFPPPDNAARPLDALVFVDPAAVPDPLGVVVERGTSTTHTLVAPRPLARLGVALSGAGWVRIRHGAQKTGATLEPGRTQLLLLEPRRTFPWFKHFYRLTIAARDARVYARILPSACDIGGSLLAAGQWAEAVRELEACRETRWREPTRLLDLARAHARLGHQADAAQALDELRRVAPNLVEQLVDLSARPDGDAWRERYRALAGHPSWFWDLHTVRFEAEAATERVGTVVPSEAASGAQVVRAEPADGAGYLKIWLPQHFLRGRYLVRFRVRGAPAAAGPLATLSVVRHFQNRVYDVPATRDWRGEAGPGFREVVLALATELEPVKLEPRVFYHGRGRLDIDAVVVVPDLRAALTDWLEPLRFALPPRAGSGSTRAPGG